MGVSQLQGTPWHIEFLHSDQPGNKRLRTKCVFYHSKTIHCLLGGKCSGVVNCSSYSEKTLDLRKIFPQPLSEDEIDPLNVLRMLNSVAEMIRPKLNAHLFGSPDTAVAAIKEALTELGQYIKIGSIHIISRDVRYLFYAIIAAYDHQVIRIISGKTILPFILDVFWMAFHDHDYKNLTILNGENSSLDIIDFISSSDFQSTIFAYRPSAFLIEYSAGLQNGFTHTNLIRYLAMRNPAGVK